MPATILSKFLRLFLFLSLFLFIGGAIYLFIPQDALADVNPRSLVPGCYTYGDLDNDGNIDHDDGDILDLSFTADSSTGWLVQRADLDADGDVDVQDKVRFNDYHGGGTYYSWGVCTPVTKPIMPCTPTGDVHTNGVISRFDALLVLEHVGGIITLSATQLENGDADNHGFSTTHPVTSGDLAVASFTLLGTVIA